MLGMEFCINKLTLHFSIPIHNKFTVLLDNSGTGKTYLISNMLRDYDEHVFRVFEAFGDLTYLTTKRDNIIVFDESDFYKFMRKHDVNLLLNSKNPILIIARSIPEYFPIDYRAIYRLVCKDKINYSVNRYFVDQLIFIESDKYFVEDSGSGFQYYSSKLENVLSLHGKSGILSHIYDSGLCIADGSVFADILSKCMRPKSKLKFYLPDSFEGLVLENTPRASEIVINAHKDPVLDFMSIERYYTAKIKDIYPNYNKTKLMDTLYNKVLFNKIPEVFYKVVKDLSALDKLSDIVANIPEAVITCNNYDEIYLSVSCYLNILVRI